MRAWRHQTGPPCADRSVGRSWAASRAIGRSVWPLALIVKQAWYRRGVPRRLASRGILIGLAALTLGACVSARENGKGFDAGARRRLPVNWTTRREVEAMVGRPKTTLPGADRQGNSGHQH